MATAANTTKSNNRERTLNVIIKNSAHVKDRIIYLSEEIDCGLYGDVLPAFRYLDSTPGPITLMLNSPGGDITYMFSIYDLMRTATNDIITVGTGEICSATVLLLVCGARRYVTENTVLMSHKGSVDFAGNIEDIKSRMNWVNWYENQWAKLMARHTPRDEKYWKQIGRKEAELWVLGGEKIVEEGFADRVIEENLGEFLKKSNKINFPPKSNAS